MFLSQKYRNGQKFIPTFSSQRVKQSNTGAAPARYPRSSQQPGPFTPAAVHQSNDHQIATAPARYPRASQQPGPFTPAVVHHQSNDHQMVADTPNSLDIPSECS